MQRYTVYLYLETALRVPGGTTTHHQERKQLYLQHLVFVRPVTATCRYSVMQPGTGLDYPHLNLVPKLKKDLSYTSAPHLGLHGLF